jgi:rhodanese-related sulfurtransferase
MGSAINKIKRFLGFEIIDIASLIESGAIILDVRNFDEYQQDHIPGSILIPLPELKSRLSELNTFQKPIVAYCRSGRRSGIAKRMLNKHGMQAYNGGGLNKMKKLIKI